MLLLTFSKTRLIGGQHEVNQSSQYEVNPSLPVVIHFYIRLLVCLVLVGRSSLPKLDWSFHWQCTMRLSVPVPSVLTSRRLPKYSMKNIGLWYLSKVLGDLGKKCEGGVCEGWNFWEWQMGLLPEENLKITFFTDAPFIVKFRFDK